LTTVDYSLRAGTLTTPFFQLGEIERRLRRCLEPVFPIEEIRNNGNGYTGTSTGNCSSGLLDEARIVRNQIMHFGARPLTDTQKQQVNVLLNFMRHLDTLS
jgi:hypothetical protein